MFLNLYLALFLTFAPIAQPLPGKERSPQQINSLKSEITAKSAIVIDAKNKKVLYEKNIHQPFPIASLTKLVTALVFLDIYSSPSESSKTFSPRLDWEKPITIIPGDQAEGAKLFVKPGEKIKVKDLFYSMLVGSANNATKALVRSTGLSQEEFVKRMNQKTKKILNNYLLKSRTCFNKMPRPRTFFTEPTGLSPKNISTACEIALIAEEILKNEKIREAVSREKYTFRMIGSKTLRTVKNIDEVLKNSLKDSKNQKIKRGSTELIKNYNQKFKVIAGKTGYLEEAGYCLLTQAKKNKHRVIAVILGTQNSKARFQEMKKILEKNFQKL